MIRIWELPAGRLLHAWEAPGQSLPGQTVAFSPDGRWVASDHYDNQQVLVWALSDGQPVLEWDDGRPGVSRTWSCDFSPDGKVLVAAGVGVRAWELTPRDAGAAGPPLEARELFQELGDTRQTVRRLPTLAAGESALTYAGNIRVSPDGSRVAVANHSGRGVNLYDLASGRRLYSLPDDPGSVWWLAWHPDGRHLAVARGDGDISLWDLNAVEAVLAQIGLAP